MCIAYLRRFLTSAAIMQRYPAREGKGNTNCAPTRTTSGSTVAEGKVHTNCAPTRTTCTSGSKVSQVLYCTTAERDRGQPGRQ
ncbi:hypothetical protein FKM82_025221 [Ascaphus truei]